MTSAFPCRLVIHGCLVKENPNREKKQIQGNIIDDLLNVGKNYNGVVQRHQNANIIYAHCE